MLYIADQTAKNWRKSPKVFFDKLKPGFRIRKPGQIVKEPQFSLSENWGFSIFRTKYKEYS